MSIGLVFLVFLQLGCDQEGIKAGEDRLLSVRIGNEQRTFILYIPDRYTSGEASPVLVAFHGTPGNGPGMRRSTRLDEIADREGWLVAYPNGIDGAWAAGCLCSDADLAGVDDLEFVRRMIVRIGEEYTVDERRVYSVGFSAGGVMSYRIACDLDQTFAASASIASSMTWAQAETCTPAGPTSVFSMIGTNDEAFPWQGSGATGGYAMPVDSTFNFWRRVDGCGAQLSEDYSPPKENGLAVRREQFPNCGGSSEVTRYVIEGGAHVWPSTANEALLAFFRRHTLSPLDLSQGLPDATGAHASAHSSSSLPPTVVRSKQP